jgi:hypothetical protein
LKNVVRKQQNVNPAIPLSVKAKIVFNLDKTVFIFLPVNKTEIVVSSLANSREMLFYNIQNAHWANIPDFVVFVVQQ